MASRTNSFSSSATTSRRASIRPQSRAGSSASRPRTGGSRPSTARPGTGVSTNGDSSSYVVAVLEGRGVAREIGMAALDKDTGRCVLFQIPDCQTCRRHAFITPAVHNPSAILVPDTFMPMEASNKQTSSLLVDTMQEEFGEDGVTEFVPVARKYWNDQNGLEAINRLIINDGEKAGTLVAVSNKYYALSAAGALFKYVETRMNTIFTLHSLRISYRSVEGTMMIDCETARNLELVQSNTVRKSKNSLFGLLNHTFTPMAHRQDAIDRRLDVVQELVNDEEKYTAIRDALKTVKKIDLDKLIAQLTTSENRPVGGTTGNAKGAAARVDQMINLRNVIRSLPGVVKALQGCRSSLLCMISDMLDDDRVKSIDEVVSQGLNEDAISASNGGGFGGSGFGAITKKVYAVKANFNRFLDVARETYRENVTDIIDLQNELTKEHDLPLGLQYQENGFVFILKKGDTPEGGKLPAAFINVSAKKNQKWTFSHLELKKRNARLRDSLDEALILSDQIVKALVERIVEDVGVLYKASEAIALMDMLWAFAHTSILHRYTRPEFTGTLAIKAGRHPVLETLQAAGNFVPNDTYACDGSCFQIVEGPNMSGLELARLADLPSSVLAVARGVSTKLKAQDDWRQAASESNAIAARRKITLRLRVQLEQTLEHSALDDEALLKYLEGIQRDMVLALKDLLPYENPRPSKAGVEGTPLSESLMEE
ncbi:MutS protein msh4 [Ceratobasidium sp. 392]|nr:MutS protein msh4 [Ceratobasidium sp. 392]